MSARASLLAIVALAITLLLLPGSASGAEPPFIVTTTAEEADDNLGNSVCHAAGGGCTLRAAVEEANATVAKDTIEFNGVFDGELADTIALTGPLPITKPVTIVGPNCQNASGSLTGPCVGVSGPTGNFGLQVENANETEIIGLSVTGALVGIDVINSSESFKALRNWVGVKLDGTVAANNTGLFLDPHSDSAVIGKPGEGNVIAGNNNEGLDLEGASSARIQGNLFGVAPDGATQAANAKDIEITGSTAGGSTTAAGNVVGEQVETAAAGTPKCDEGCNVIAGAISYGIDLKGNGAGENEEPAGETMIWGNHIGLNAAGTGVVANGSVGILVGEADEIKIGGPSAEFANHINGGTAGIQAGPAAQDLLVERNLVGLNHPGTATLSPPGAEGVLLKAEGAQLNHQARIAKNVISMGSGIPIEVEKGGPTGTTIFDNLIGRGTGGQSLTGGAFGIRVDGPPGTGNTIERNVVENAHLGGMLLESSNNSVIENEVLGTESGSGIIIQNFLGVQEASGNTIGGDTAAEENLISGSGGDAIEILNGIDTDNHILRNTGSGNTGLFIDLGGDGLGNHPSGPNDGIQAPAIDAATPTAASGSGALPNATVRVFEKATSQNGEIKGFLGEVKADSGGNWKFEYKASLPEGTEIGVTQTGLEGTSELALAMTATPPPPGGGGGGNGGAGGGAKEGGKQKKEKNKGKGKGKDKTPPQTTITKGPARRTHKHTAKFKFSSSEPGSTFQCKLDRKPFKQCRSPKKYTGLKSGKHVFKVRATDASGNTDQTPAVKKFTVVR